MGLQAYPPVGKWALSLCSLAVIGCATGAPGHPNEDGGGRGFPNLDAGQPSERDAGMPREPPAPPPPTTARDSGTAEEDSGPPAVDAAEDAPEDGCANAAKDGFETGTDCGGPECAACALGGGCIDDGDCEQGLCEQGICGCATDTDSDGTNDCDDACPGDPLRIASGDCGCVGIADPTAAGTLCDDGECPLNMQCDGSGSCGSPADCAKPDPSCGALLVHAGHAYFVCVSSQTWGAAQAACRANARFDLVRIDDVAEQAFLEASVASLTDDAWIGATDQGTEGDWRWSIGNTPFWSGGPTGTAQGGLFVEWQTGEPSGDDCARYSRATTSWADTHCSNDPNFFVCEGQ